MSTTAEFLSTLRGSDVQLWVEDGQLKCDAPLGVLDDAMRAQLVARKQELLTLLLEAQPTLGAARSVVPLKPTGDAAPLFARPGHNGDVFCYRALAAHLDPGQPLYGVEPKGLRDGLAPDTVEEMAAYEVAQIRSVQAEGPYYLAGYCAGGTITFETARQITLAGEHVSRLVLFGAPFPAAYRGGWAERKLRWVRNRAERHGPALRSGSIADRLQYIRDRTRARAAEEAKRHDPALASRRRIEDATVSAVRRYEPEFYAGRIDLVLPNAGWRHSGERVDEWKRVATRVVEHLAPDEADGDFMLREPYAQGLAAMLTGLLRDDEEPRAPATSSLTRRDA